MEGRLTQKSDKDEPGEDLTAHGHTSENSSSNVVTISHARRVREATAVEEMRGSDDKPGERIAHLHYNSWPAPPARFAQRHWTFITARGPARIVSRTIPARGTPHSLGHSRSVALGDGAQDPSSVQGEGTVEGLGVTEQRAVIPGFRLGTGHVDGCHQEAHNSIRHTCSPAQAISGGSTKVIKSWRKLVNIIQERDVYSTHI